MKKAPTAVVADRLETRPLAKLKAYKNNARTHPPEQIEALVASIEQFGFTIPLLIDETGMILAGHGRLVAAEKRGMTDVPVMVARGWSDEKKRAYIIADNRLTEGGGWDRQILGTELGNLSLAGVNLDALGFNPGEITALIAMSQKAHSDPDDAPPAPAVPVSRLGDLWILGEHRVLCGDATSGAAVSRLYAGRKPHLMVTDPPYGVDYDPNWRNEAVRSDGKLIGGRATGKVANDAKADWREAWAHFTGEVLYVWHGGLHCGLVQAGLTASKFVLRAQIVWVKPYLIIGRGNFHWQHEPLYYAQREGAADDHWHFEEEHSLASYAVRMGESSDWRGGRKQSTVWNIDVVKNDTGHGTQKPVECMARPIRNNSKGGDFIYDPFLGSGTTLIAAHDLGRVCLGLELDPVYVDVIVRRWEAHTGLSAVNETTGKTFEKMKEARLGEEKKNTGAAVATDRRATARNPKPEAGRNAGKSSNGPGVDRAVPNAADLDGGADGKIRGGVGQRGREA